MKITQKDLSKLNMEELAMHLQNSLITLSPAKRRRWIRENMPEILKPKIKGGPEELLTDIETFIKESNGGSYISWVTTDDHYYDYGDDEIVYPFRPIFFIKRYFQKFCGHFLRIPILDMSIGRNPSLNAGDSGLSL